MHPHSVSATVPASARERPAEACVANKSGSQRNATTRDNYKYIIGNNEARSIKVPKKTYLKLDLPKKMPFRFYEKSCVKTTHWCE